MIYLFFLNPPLSGKNDNVEMKTTSDLHHVLRDISNSSVECTVAAVIGSIKSLQQGGKKRTIPFTEVCNDLIQKYCINDAATISLPNLKSKVVNTYAAFQKLTKHVDRNWNSIIDFLNGPFQFPVVTGTVNRAKQDLNGACASTTGSEISKDTDSSPVVVVDLSTPASPVKTRRDCSNVTCKALKLANKNLSDSVQKQKKRIFLSNKLTSSLKQQFKCRTVNQKEKRHKQKIDELKLTNSSLQRKIRFLNRQLENIKSQNHALIKDNLRLLREAELFNLSTCKINDQLKETKAALHSQEKDLKNTKQYCDYLTSLLLENDSKETIISKQGSKYSCDIRLCIYKELLCDVPVAHCGSILNEFSEILMNKSLTNTPSAATCAQMAYELGVLSSVQVAEFLLNHRPLCLSWDATTVDGAHVNEIHVTSKRDTSICLDVRHIPGGRASDYVTHITEVLSDTASLYARFQGKKEEDILSGIHDSISCTLTDRAPVNACVTRQLCEELQSQLLQLNCNVHPLDSVSRSAQANLLKLDTRQGIKGLCFGSSGSAANLINAISVLR